MLRPGCFLLAVIVAIAALIAALGQALSIVTPMLKAHQVEHENK